jgi:hypothetical protein
MLCDQTGSGKSKKVAAKTEELIFQLADQLGTRNEKLRYVEFFTSGEILQQ